MKEKESFSEFGKKGARKFWKMFYKDPILRARIIKSRKASVGTKWIKEVSKKGVEAKKKKRELEENNLKERINKKMQNEYYKKLLARLCGFLMGDGCVTMRREKQNNIVHYDLAFYPDNKEVANIFIKSFNELYEKEPALKDKGKFFTIRVSSKVAYQHLSSMANFKSMTWKVPTFITKSNKTKIEFIRAFFDCEAYVGKKNIQVQSVNCSGLNKIKKMLKQFMILSKIYAYQRKNKNWNTNYILVISRKENIKRYAQLIGFNHLSKQEKLMGLPACQNGKWGGLENRCPQGRLGSNPSAGALEKLVSLQISRFDSWSGRFILLHFSKT